MKNRLWVGVASLCGAMMLAPAPAQASTLQFTGLGANEIVTVSATHGSDTITAGSFYAGELTWQWLNPVPAGSDQSFYTYCVDLFSDVTPEQEIADPLETTDALTNGVPGSGDKVAWLVNHFAGAVHDSGIGIDAAALQVAIWEVLYDATPDLASGNFQLLTADTVYTGQTIALAIADTATSYLTQLFAATDGPITESARFLDVSALGQDQVTRVPEPALLLLFGTGLLAVAGAGRRLRRRG